MVQRQKDLEEDMQENLSINLTLNAHINLGIIIPEFRLTDKRIDMKLASVDVKELKECQTTTWDNLNILKHPCFLPFGLCYLNFGLAYQLVFTYFGPMTMGIAHIGRCQSATLLTIMGATNIAGRILCGYMNDFKILSPIFWYGIGCLFGGICLNIFPMCTNYMLLACMSGFYGLCTAMICCNQWLAGLHIFGIKHFSKAMGYLECIGGASTLAGGALLTYISKINGEEIDYQLMMSTAGGVFGANTLLALICFLITEHSRKREKEKAKRNRT